MKTIAMCALLAALAFGLLPGNRDEAAAPDEGLVLLVETQQDAQAPQKASSARQNESEKAAVQTAPDAQTVRLLDGGAVTALSMEDYLTGVLLSEMPADFEPEARKAQAVAARTFTCRKLLQPKHENADVCADFSCCQAWTSREQLRQKYGASFDAVWSAAREAVRQTAGEVLTYDGQLILSNDTTRGLIDTYNNFLGLNIGDSPLTLIRNAWAVGAIGIVIGAILIPLLSAATQWINVKLMPQQPTTNGNDQASTMAQSMKTMNMVMPLMSAWFCFTLPAGMGLYWIAGSVVRGIQQVVINRHIDKMDFDDIIKKNSVKSAKKLEKMKAAQEKMNAYANMSTRNIQSKANSGNVGSADQKSQTVDSSGESTKPVNAKPGSMMAKANMVRQYNEKNNNGSKDN